MSGHIADDRPMLYRLTRRLPNRDAVDEGEVQVWTDGPAGAPYLTAWRTRDPMALVWPSNGAIPALWWPSFVFTPDGIRAFGRETVTTEALEGISVEWWLAPR